MPNRIQILFPVIPFFGLFCIPPSMTSHNIVKRKCSNRFWPQQIPHLRLWSTTTTLNFRKLKRLQQMHLRIFLLCLRNQANLTARVGKKLICQTPFSRSPFLTLWPKLKDGPALIIFHYPPLQWQVLCQHQRTETDTIVFPERLRSYKMMRRRQDNNIVCIVYHHQYTSFSLMSDEK